MRSHLLVAIFAMGCGETQLGPFQPLPIGVRFEVAGNDATIHIARDRNGVAHVYAQTHRDLGFGQGYVMAHDRFAQMELLRRFASGTLAELYGVTDPTTIDIDKEMRFHQLRTHAEATWIDLQQIDPIVADMLVRFADGVNAYQADVAANRWSLDPAIDAELSPLFEPVTFEPWTPIDSIAIFRLFTLAQSWTVPAELEMTELDIKLRRTFSAALARDVLAIAPIPALGVAPQPTPAGTPAPATRPVVPDALLASARAFFERGLTTDRAQTLGPAAFMRPALGSNAFVIGSDFTGEQVAVGTSILAADMQVAPMNPSAFYPMHQLISGELPEDPLVHDVIGLMVPGVPIVIAGTNGDVGWAPTVGTHDVGDIYLEQLASATIQNIPEVIRVGNFGDIQFSETVTYERIPGHGLLIPNHPPDTALSIRHTGYATTHELLVMWNLGDTAHDVGAANAVLRGLVHGPHYMVIDSRGAYAWSSYADVPVRQPAARAWSPASPDAAAPFFVLDGTNPAHEWDGTVPSEELPFHSGLEPAIVIADSDPNGATADGDPLNQPYTGVAYGNGLRDNRIRALIGASTTPIDRNAALAIQQDTQSTLAAHLKDEIVRQLDLALPALTGAQLTNATLARDVLAQWTLDTPQGMVAADGNSGATLFFATWMHDFIAIAIGDELAAAGYTRPLSDDRAARIVYRLVIAPSTLAQHPITNEPLLCGAGGCRALIVQAALSAIANLTADGSGRDDWRWGRRHAVRFRTLFPDPNGALLLPTDPEMMTGFQLAGDMFSVDRSDGGWADLDFTPQTALAYRLQLVGNPFGRPLAMRLVLPTGTVLDTRDPHYRDLLETSYLERTAFDVYLQIDDINHFGESRWELR